jgi:hypothetical protein
MFDLNLIDTITASALIVVFGGGACGLIVFAFMMVAEWMSSDNDINETLENFEEL